MSDSTCSYLNKLYINHYKYPGLLAAIHANSCSRFCGRHFGRRTNLDYADAVKGMSKRNRTFTLDEEGIHLLEETVAHMRETTLLPEPFEEKIFFGRDVDLPGVRKAIEQGAKVGKEKICKHTNFSENYFIKL